MTVDIPVALVAAILGLIVTLIGATYTHALTFGRLRTEVHALNKRLEAGDEQLRDLIDKIAKLTERLVVLETEYRVEQRHDSGVAARRLP